MLDAAEGDRQGPHERSSERRTARRWSITADAKVRVGNDVVVSRIVSISSSGLLVRTNATLSVGDRIRVVLDDPRITSGFALEGIVVRSVGTTAGVALIDIDATTMAVVREVVARTTANNLLSG